MIIQNAVMDDKIKVLEFCKNTFSWGDYIDLVWDFWIKENNLLCVYDKNNPVGICHVSLSANTDQIWIEGIRIHPSFRKKHLATDLIEKSELIGLQNHCTASFMLIENTNAHSLSLANKLKYKIFETWIFYSIMNSSILQNTSASFLSSFDDVHNLNSFRFVNSWRWFPLNAFFRHELMKNKQIISVKKDDFTSIATIIPSEHFVNTLLVTIICGNQFGINEIIKFVQNYCFTNKFSRIQLLVKNNIDFLHNDVEEKLIFHLMKKEL